MVQGRVLGRGFLFQGGEGVLVESAVHRPATVEATSQAGEIQKSEKVKTSDPRPAVQRVSVERGRVWQHLLPVRWSLMMVHVRLVGRWLDAADCLPSDLKGSSPACLTFDPSVHLGADPIVDLSIDLALMVGSDGVPQIPVPQT